MTLTQAEHVAVVLAVAFGVLPLVADLFYYRGQVSVSVLLDPIQARYHRALGEQLIGSGDVRGGAAELRRAGELGESDAGAWVELGDAEQGLGDLAAARAAYARARELDPAISVPAGF